MQPCIQLVRCFLSYCSCQVRFGLPPSSLKLPVPEVLLESTTWNILRAEGIVCLYQDEQCSSGQGCSLVEVEDYLV